MTDAERDALLVVRAQLGDRQALGELVGHWHLPVWRYVRAMLGDRARADDVSQEAWARALRALPGLRQPERFAPWLLTIARRCVQADLKPGPDRARLNLDAGRTGRQPEPGREDRRSDPERASRQPGPGRADLSPSAGRPGRKVDRADWGLGHDEPGPDPGTSDEFAGVLDRAQVTEGLAAVPLREREVLILFYLHDLALDDCAQILGIPAGTVKSRLNRARRMVRDHLTSRGYTS